MFYEQQGRPHCRIGGANKTRRFRLNLFQRRIMNNIRSDFDSRAAIAEMRRRHVLIGRRMQEVALRALEELEAKVAVGQPLKVSAEDAKILLDAGAKLERAAMGDKEQEGDAPMLPGTSKRPN